MVNEFENLEADDEAVPEQEFSDAPAQKEQFTSSDNELTPSDFQADIFLKNPDVNEELILLVDKVVRNKNISGKNKTTGEEFSIGLKKKDGTIMRNDIICEEGRYTVSAWEIFYKLFGVEGILTQYGKKNGSFKGCKFKIKRMYDGSFANKKVSEIMILKSMTEELATAYQKEVGLAMKEKKLYIVEEITS